jgi:hypothetical protein
MVLAILEVRIYIENPDEDLVVKDPRVVDSSGRSGWGFERKSPSEVVQISHNDRNYKNIIEFIFRIYI